MKKVSEMWAKICGQQHPKRRYTKIQLKFFRGSVLKKKKKEAFCVVTAARVCDSGDNFLLSQSSTVLGAWNIRTHTYEIKVN